MLKWPSYRPCFVGVLVGEAYANTGVIYARGSKTKLCRPIFVGWGREQHPAADAYTITKATTLNNCKPQCNTAEDCLADNNGNCIRITQST